MRTVGLYDMDVRLFYVDERFVVLQSPNGDGTIIVSRREGRPNEVEALTVLRKLGMTPIEDEWQEREDGLLFRKVREEDKEI